LLSTVDLLLNYSNRFYERQFITRKAVHNDLLVNTEQFLTDYFDKEDEYVATGVSSEFQLNC